MFSYSFTQLSPLFGELYVRPVEDGQFVPGDPNKLVAEGLFNEADVMIGVAQDEGTYFILSDEADSSKPTFDRSAYRDKIRQKFETEDDSVVDMIAFIYSTPEQVGVRTVLAVPKVCL